MDFKVREIVVLVDDNGKCPYREWRNNIRDTSLGAAIDARLARVRNGNFGDHKSVGAGVYELRIPKGSGLRIYYALEGDVIVVLLAGGDKKSQSKDIILAKKLWEDYQNET
ncbi:MAG: type II toxin-antitoxin system RelE/ParE family toxin [Bdellovibrionota bacterium]|jgi:putative addiction module killer protein